MNPQDVDDGIVTSTLVSVGQGVAFDVFTREVDSWWRKEPRFRFGGPRVGTMRFEPREGGRFLEVFDSNDEFEVGRIVEWDPPRRFVFAWRTADFEPGEATEVEVRFDAEAGGTRVTIEHRGWSKLPAKHRARKGLAGGAFKALIGLQWADQFVAYGGRCTAFSAP